MMKTVPQNIKRHIIWYAKGHYGNTGDCIVDLCYILSEYCGLDIRESLKSKAHLLTNCVEILDEFADIPRALSKAVTESVYPPIYDREES